MYQMLSSIDKIYVRDPLYTQVIHFYLLFLTNLSIYHLNKVLSTEHCNFRFFLHFLPSHFIYTIPRYKGPVSLLFLSASDPLLLLLFLSIFSVLYINIPQSNFRKIFILFLSTFKSTRITCNKLLYFSFCSSEDALP